MRLAVTHLDLSHFRSHRRTRLALDGRPVALFGPNGAGKTNLLEAVSLLSPGRGLRRATSAELVRQPQQVGWRIAAELDSTGATHDIVLRAEPGQPRTTHVDGDPAPQAQLGRIVRILWLTPAMDRLWIEAAEGRRRFLDRMTLSFHPGHADASLAYDRAMRERNRLLRDDIRDARWFDAVEARMAEPGAAIQANRAAAIARIAAAQAGAETAFPTATLRVAMPDDAAETHSADALRTDLAEGRATDRRAGRTLTGPHRADLAATYTAKGVAAAQASTGEQKALLVSLVLANARALAADVGAPPILLLDEVAAHLDAGRREALYTELVTLGAQAFLTATGAEMFDTLTRAQRFHVTETDGQSAVQDADR